MMRSPDLILALVVALDVRNNPLFWPGMLLDLDTPPAIPNDLVAHYNGVAVKVIRYTRCNGYAAVVFAALGCPIPVGMTANQLFAWFGEVGGAKQGWRECSLLEAIGRANSGYPVAIVATDRPHGHVAVGVPNAQDVTRLYCSAAGASNTPRMSVADQFGKLAGAAKYFTHD